MTETRKRRHLVDDDNYSIQTKYYVNSKMVEKSDMNLMKNVYEKTLSMIFAGAKIQTKLQDNSSSIAPTSPIRDTIDDKFPEKDSVDGCKLCWKDIEITTNCVCTNCSLKICLRCTKNCTGCCALLCCNCVSLFGCSLGDDAICDNCKLFVQ